MPSEKVWGPTTDEGFDVPPSDDEDSPAHHLNTINSMEKQSWSNGKPRFLDDSQRVKDGWESSSNLIHIEYSDSKAYQNPGERLYDMGRKQLRVKAEAAEQLRH